MLTEAVANAVKYAPSDGRIRADCTYHGHRSNETVRADRFGVAVRCATDHASKCWSMSPLELVHQSRSVLARAGSANPSSASICSNVRTTFDA